MVRSEGHTLPFIMLLTWRKMRVASPFFSNTCLCSTEELFYCSARTQL